MRKFIFLLTLVMFFMAECSSANEDEKQQRIIDYTASIGAVNSEQDNFEKQKLKYEITLANEDDISIVDSPSVIPAKLIHDRLVETVRQGIEYNQDTIVINGEIIFDSRGLSKEEITNFEPLIKGLQFIADNNVEYLLLIRGTNDINL
ncbi:hypothetical protein [Bacillus solitudinis]|uniref:hypothetical protein n=1 Tax=Bacillus solitudinis TaxID=2014074 RepID=UPI000C236AE6|nr:hypothetical protein [Bacillus solitudinis]